MGKNDGSSIGQRRLYFGHRSIEDAIFFTVPLCHLTRDLGFFSKKKPYSFVHTLYTAVT